MRGWTGWVASALLATTLASCQTTPAKRFVPVTTQATAMEAMKARAMAKARTETDAQFKGFDRDRNNRLTSAEFVEGLLLAHRRELDDTLDASELAVVRRDATQEFQGLDSNRDRALSAAEFAKRND